MDFLPPLLILESLRHISGHKYGTVIALEWPSAVWWPLLVDRSGTWKSVIRTVCGLDLTSLRESSS